MADGFKDTTRTQYISGGSCFAKGGKVVGPRGAAASSKGFAKLKHGGAVKPVKKSVGGTILRAALGPIGGAILGGDDSSPSLLSLSPLGSLLAKKKPVAPIAPVTSATPATPVTTAAKGGLMRQPTMAELNKAPKLKAGVPAYTGEPLVREARGGSVRKR